MDEENISADAALLGGDNGQVHPALTVRQKLGYGVGGLATVMPQTVVGFYFPAFLLEVANVRPTNVSIITLIGRAWDAVNDPLIGVAVGKTRTRFGQFRPWMITSILPLAASYFFLWFIPEIGDTGRFYYYLAMYLLYQTVTSTYHIPLTAVVMEMSAVPKERNAAVTYRIGFETFSALIAMLVQGTVITAIKGDDDDCRPCGDEKLSSSEDKERKAYLVCAPILCGIMLICGTIAFFSVKERGFGLGRKPTSFWTQLKLAFGLRSYCILAAMTLFVWMAGAIAQSNMLLYAKYSIDFEDEFQWLMATLVVGIVASQPLWFFLMLKFGKKPTCAAGFLLAVVFMAIFGVIPARLPLGVMFILEFLCGVAVGAAILLPWQMVPDIVDEAELKCGQVEAAAFFSFFVFFQKFAAGIAVSGTTYLLEEVGGYITNPCCGEVQPDAVGDVLRWIFYAGSGMAVIGTIILYWYPLNQAEVKRIHAELKARRANDSDTMGMKSAMGDGDKMGNNFHESPGESSI